MRHLVLLPIAASRRLPRAVFALALGASLSVPAAADPAALQRCRQEPDSLLRLRCYDAIPLPPQSGAIAPAPRTTAAPAAAPAAAASAAPAAATAAAPAAAAAAAPASPAARFGLESRPQPVQAEAVDSIQSYIPGRVDGWLPGTRFRLANGQVWEISDGSRAAHDLRDPRVRVTRGLSGSFFMEIDGAARTPRVRRVE